MSEDGCQACGTAIDLYFDFQYFEVATPLPHVRYSVKLCRSCSDGVEKVAAKFIAYQCQSRGVSPPWESL